MTSQDWSAPELPDIRPTEKCHLCLGGACEYGCRRCRHIDAGPDSHKVCNRCGGTGREPESDR